MKMDVEIARLKYIHSPNENEQKIKLMRRVRGHKQQQKVYNSEGSFENIIKLYNLLKKNSNNQQTENQVEVI